MRILWASDYAAMPWKNGGGVTTQIASSPADAGLDDFEWRVSMAQVAKGGPFSAFAGVDRTLAVLSGEGIALKVEGRRSTRLTAVSKPLAFPGDVPTGAELIGGPILDLNAMSRRGRFTHEMARHLSETPVIVPGIAEATLVLSRSARLTVSCARGVASLDVDDSVLLSPDDGDAEVKPSGAGEFYVVAFRRARH